MEEREGRACGEGEPEGEGEFDCGIAPGDGLLAVAAARAKTDPAEEGDVVVPGDGVETVRAVRARLAQAAVVGQAGDADIEKASEEQAEEKGGQLEDERSGEHESSV